jgi:hypothetical protein
MPSPVEIGELKRQWQALKEQVAKVGEMRPGTLIPRYRKCGKPSCPCAREGHAGHGPSWSLTQKVEGKTVTRVIPAGRALQTEEQIAEFQRFRSLTRELVEVSTRLCDARLRADQADPERAAEKGGSVRPSRSRSAKRSKRSSAPTLPKTSRP